MPTHESFATCRAGLADWPWLASCVARPREFVMSCWQTAPAIFRGACSHADYLTWSDIVRLIERRAISPDLIRLIRDGRRPAYPANTHEAPPLDRNSLRLMLSQGYTLNLSALETALPAIRDLCTGLGRELGQIVTANAYLTPPSSQALPAHFDGHDVLVLQLQGEKGWQVFGRHAERPAAPQTAKPSGMPLLAVSLRPGDSLYVPRGFVHNVATAARPSLHISIAMLPRSGAAPGDRSRA
jgi:bifunctional lysine-specific demethylase and histidyl-hydroxylase NO66